MSSLLVRGVAQGAAAELGREAGTHLVQQEAVSAALDASAELLAPVAVAALAAAPVLAVVGLVAYAAYKLSRS